MIIRRDGSGVIPTGERGYNAANSVRISLENFYVEGLKWFLGNCAD